MDKETSSRISSLAAQILDRTPLPEGDNETIGTSSYNILLAQAQRVAGSALSQDQTPGQSGGISDGHGIHPTPAEFTDSQMATDPILHFFHYAHLPPVLQATSRMFFLLAAHVINTVPRNPERTVALRKLLEAKDAAVRANLPAPKLGGQGELKIEPKLGEPVETGGHDEDRDGPVPFNG